MAFTTTLYKHSPTLPPLLPTAKSCTFTWVTMAKCNSGVIWPGIKMENVNTTTCDFASFKTKSSEFVEFVRAYIYALKSDMSKGVGLRMGVPALRKTLDSS